MSRRVTPSERLRAEVDEVFAGGADLATMVEQVAQLGARLLLQTALEAEVSEFLGRERYARAASCEDVREGSRNGYGQTTIKTTSGPVTLRPPKLRNTTEAFASRLLGTGVTKTHALESLVIAGFVRGLSTRDVEATLAEALGEQATVSRSTVSRICAQISEEMASLAAASPRRARAGLPVPGRLASSATTWARPPSRCSRRGASPPRASRCSSGWPPPPGSPPTPGRGS